jgi:hypothetical protein
VLIRRRVWGVIRPGRISHQASRTKPVAATFAALVVLVGCSGEDKQARQRCLDEAYNAAEAAAVARLFDQGKLGSQKKVEAELGVPGRPGSDYFDSAGHLIPYRELPDRAHKIQLLTWMHNDKDVAEKTFEARQAARANAHPDC